MKITSSTSVESGIVKDAISKLSGMFEKFVDIIDKSLDDAEIDVQETKLTKDGGWLETLILPDERLTKLYMKVVPTDKTEDSHYYNIYLKDKFGNEEKFENVDVNHIDETLLKYIDDTYHIDEKLAASKHLDVELSMISGSSEIVINKIYSSYDADTSLAIIEDITSEPSIQDELASYDSVGYSIVDQGDSYDVQKSDVCIDLADCINKILVCGYQCLIALTSIQNKKALKCIRDYSYDNIKSCIDFFMNENTLHQLDIPVCSINFVTCMQEAIDNTTEICYAEDVSECFAATLELYRCNFPEEIQSYINSQVLSLRYM